MRATHDWHLPHRYGRFVAETHAKVIVLGEIFARALLIERVRAQAAGCISFRTCAGLSKLRLRF